MWESLRRLFAGARVADAGASFLDEAERLARSLSHVASVTRAPEPLTLDFVTTDGLEHRLYFGNLAEETREVGPAERRARLVQFLEILGRESGSWTDVRGSIVPVVRAATYGIERPLLRRPFLPFLDVMPVVDEAAVMHFIGRARLEQWGVTEDEVFAAAYGNDRLARSRIELHDEVNGPLWVVADKDSFEASRLLVPGWLASFRDRVEGSPVAIVPERATLWVGGDRRPEMIERLVDKAEREFVASPRCLSPALYTIDDEGAVVPYVRRGSDALAMKVRVAHQKLALYEYAAQQRALQPSFERTGAEIFVASYDAYQGEADVSSLSVWTEGVDTYLPRTDRVVLVQLDAELRDLRQVHVAFDAVADRLTRVPDLHPARYRTGTFPTAAELDALEKAAATS